jgi:hypothetical protein
MQESGKPGTPFKPLAVKVKEFQTKTPARFRTKATPADPPKPLVMTHAQVTVTVTMTVMSSSRAVAASPDCLVYYALYGHLTGLYN